MIFIVNYYQYKVRCNKAIPVSGHWDDILPCGDCSQITMFVQLCKHKGVIPVWDPVFFTNSPKVFHSITQNPYSPNPMHYLQLSFLDPRLG
ncbi:hypothetical protein [Wolbachia endosymbiont (group A) of Bibio marci]|uniref:hypothetical protein n=1 Tax=Wolbachia endosymbiont (group A) of Bibio marci TaxID=2953987 RepID=UPI0022324ECE|nr:hypothetical protein [Wolbachia endosymbiont (group A) of Bibio marci]